MTDAMGSLVAPLAAMLVASGGFRLFLPTVSNGLEWIGSADAIIAACRVETLRSSRVSPEPEEWSPWKTYTTESYQDRGGLISSVDVSSGYTRTTQYYYFRGLPVYAASDIDGDGVADSIARSVYNKDSLRVLTEHRRHGVLEARYRLFYDHDQRFIREELDDDGDGIVDVRTTREYGPANEVVRDSRYLLNSNSHWVNDHSYTNGWISSTRVRFFGGGDIKSDGEDRYAYDEAGRLVTVSSRSENLADGRLFVHETTYEYGAHGHVVHKIERDITRNHVWDIQYVYDEREFLTDVFSSNYLGDVVRTQYLYRGCTLSPKNFAVEVRTFAGLVQGPP